MSDQQALRFRTWGGARTGAGRPRTSRAMPHGARERVPRYQPIHVTLRMADHVWNLRSERSYAVIHRALDGVRRREDLRVVHFGIVGNHVHLIVEAEGSRALSNAVRALAIRVARGLNRMMGTRGPAFADRFHARVLSTPAEVRNAVRYVVGNYASHAARRGQPLPEGWRDPFSSAVVKTPRVSQGILFAQAVTRDAETWLLSTSAAPGDGGSDISADAARRLILSA